MIITLRSWSAGCCSERLRVTFSSSRENWSGVRVESQLSLHIQGTMNALMIPLGERRRRRPAHLDNVSLRCVDDPMAVCLVPIGLGVAGTSDGPLGLEERHGATSWPCCESPNNKGRAFSVLTESCWWCRVARLVFSCLVLNAIITHGSLGWSQAVPVSGFGCPGVTWSAACFIPHPHDSHYSITGPCCVVCCWRTAYAVSMASMPPDGARARALPDNSTTGGGLEGWGRGGVLIMGKDLKRENWSPPLLLRGFKHNVSTLWCNDRPNQLSVLVPPPGCLNKAFSAYTGAQKAREVESRRGFILLCTAGEHTE